MATRTTNTPPELKGVGLESESLSRSLQKPALGFTNHLSYGVEIVNPYRVGDLLLLEARKKLAVQRLIEREAQ
ncbi:hypothetical protein [Candidatus Aquiluna sp. UB-MaderosW2red]|uniref:hypothetical protein n=1 Tax=Candidatus Aquiluna sp. UB-MaderosW2red TaxID=1855377 RepID=UPI000B82709E|nr:hypothetical protein [Candidatus Aquiluna sp. UB-MaderosW2red]